MFGFWGIFFWLFIIGIALKIVLPKKPRSDEKAKIEWFLAEMLDLKHKRIITDEQYKHIHKEYEKRLGAPGTKLSSVAILSIIGSTLLGIGVILFVASNWEKIPDIVRTLMLLTTTFATFYAGYYFAYDAKSYPVLGKSLLFLAAIFWGASIALIAQIYHMSSSDNWFILLAWTVPIFPIAYFLESRPVYLLSSAIFAVWGVLYTSSKNVANYYYPLIVLAILLPLSKDEVCDYLNIAALFAFSMFSMGSYDYVVLLAAVGILLHYILKQDLKFGISGSAFAVLWMISFFVNHESFPNFFYLIPLAFYLYATYKTDAFQMLPANIIGAIIWVNLLLASMTQSYKFDDEGMFALITIMMLLIGAILYLLGVAERSKERKEFSWIFKIFGYLMILVVTYALSYMSVSESVLKSYTGLRGASAYFLGDILFLVLGFLALFISFMTENFGSKIAKYEGFTIAITLVTAAAYLFAPQALTLGVVLSNIVLLVIAVSTIVAGVEIESPHLFNIGIVIFVIFLITRYFDVMWKLLPRSVFFMVGGLLMLIGSVFIEKKRREVVGGMKGD